MTEFISYVLLNTNLGSTRNNNRLPSNVPFRTRLTTILVPILPVFDRRNVFYELWEFRFDYRRLSSRILSGK